MHQTKRIKVGTVVRVANGRCYLVHAYDPGERRRLIAMNGEER